jgi:hypothetical protein
VTCGQTTSTFELPELLEHVPLAVRYMHDGAPAHFSCAVRDVSNTYHDGCTSRGRPRCLSSIIARFQSSGFWPVEIPKHPRHLLMYAAVRDETCRGVHSNLMEDILSNYKRALLQIISWTHTVWTVRTVFTCFGIRNSCLKFNRNSQLHSL